MSSIPWFSEQETPPPSPKPQPKTAANSEQQSEDSGHSKQEAVDSKKDTAKDGKEGVVQDQSGNTTQGVGTVGQSSPVHKKLPRVRMPSEVVKKLRDMADKQVLHMRHSSRCVGNTSSLKGTKHWLRAKYCIIGQVIWHLIEIVTGTSFTHSHSLGSMMCCM